MPRLTAFLLAGALCWPAVGYAQTKTTDVAPWATQRATPTTSVPLGAIRQAPTPMPMPTGSVAVPDVSGMPAGDSMGGTVTTAPNGWGNGVFAPSPARDPGHRAYDIGGPCGWVTWAEGLWLQPHRSDPFLYHAVTSVDPGTGTITTTLSGREYDTEEDFGFRLGAGYLFERGVYGTISYTFFDGDTGDQTFAVPAGTVGLFYTGPGPFAGLFVGPGSTVSQNWDIEYHTLDLTAGLVLSPTCFVDLFLGAGLRLAEINQDYDFEGTIGDVAGISLTALSEGVSLDMRGIGPRLGGEGRLYLLPCFALYARGYTSVLFTNRDDTADTSIQTAVGGVLGPVIINEVTYDHDDVIPALDVAIGMELSIYKGHVLIGGGYEFNYWWNLGNSEFLAVDVLAGSVNSLQKHSDISLDGLFVRLTVLW